ncbi:MAG: bifunctional hydroxymethylpyrimidine kinase/phosphomethylpyrimidine kinase [Rhodospirillaceae bacterium]|nr:bifunctional hydroxymethylpyrimidine kinase/phosphomethylpyrimidine kinase [Rhodospirillaceae bacterium]
MPRTIKGRVLVIAGSDSGGGAGIQADIKTVTALSGFATTAITALTAQNTQGVHGIFEVPVDFIIKQMSVVLSDIGADCIKIGMLHRADIIEAVAETLNQMASDIPIVLDPVMVAKGGHSLLEDDAMSALKNSLLPMASVLTPNIPEAEAISGMAIKNVDDMVAAGEAILALGPGAVLVKGGHLPNNKDENLSDVLLKPGSKVEIFSGPRINTTSTHGTGCTTASAIATGLAQGMELSMALRRARAYVLEAIKTAPGFGSGHGPLNHAHTCVKFD